MFAVITENSIRMAKEASKDMRPYDIQLLRGENVRLQQKNAKLNTLLQILNPPVVGQVSFQTRNIPVQQMPLQLPNVAVLLSTPNAALLNEIQMLQRENTRLKQENNDLVSKVRPQVEAVLQTVLQYE